MELKELAGDRDMFDVLKQHKKGKNKRQITKHSKSDLKPKKAPTDVFEFINKKLCGKKGRLQFFFHVIESLFCTVLSKSYGTLIISYIGVT